MSEQQPPPERRTSPERQSKKLRPGIWVAKSWDALTGTWWDATGTPERLRERIGDLQVYDTIEFGSFQVRPDDEPALIAAVANGIAEHGAAFAAWAELHDADPAMLTAFPDSFLGHFASPAAWLRQIAEAASPEELATDFEALAHEVAESGEVLFLPADDGGVWIFTTDP